LFAVVRSAVRIAITLVTVTALDDRIVAAVREDLTIQNRDIIAICKYLNISIVANLHGDLGFSRTDPRQTNDDQESTEKTSHRNIS
jgi:hypothetical protein